MAEAPYTNPQAATRALLDPCSRIQRIGNIHVRATSTP